jgi:hypothetical protein
MEAPTTKLRIAPPSCTNSPADETTPSQGLLHEAFDRTQPFPSALGGAARGFLKIQQRIMKSNF